MAGARNGANGPGYLLRLPSQRPFLAVVVPILRGTLLVLMMSLAGFLPSSAQTVAKYGADFLADGVGARALGMGGAYVGLADDVHSAYWNPAGLNQLEYPEVAYMHVERFAGAVTFDYAALAWPLTHRSTLAAALVRSGVNDIKNTLNAWDPQLGRPRPQPEDYITSFSAADYAFFLSYARIVSANLSFGASGKVIRRTIGPFADAWGYSVDLAAQYQQGPWQLGAVLQDATYQYQSWSVDRGAFDESIETVNPATGESYTFEEMFGAFGEGGSLPEGGLFVVQPLLRLGAAYAPQLGPGRLTLAADLDVAIDGQQTYALNTGDVSYHPRFGVEYAYRGVAALRAGLTRLTADASGELSMSPTIGAGVHFAPVSLDYSFGNFAGLASDLGYTHRVSLQVTLNRSSFRRAEAP